MAQAFDINGNEVFQVEIFTLAPIEHSETARQISADFLNSQHCGELPENMLPDLLRPIGEEEPTHIFCFRLGWTHELALQLDWLANQEEGWICSDDHGLENANHIKEKFCTVSGVSKNEVLTFLGLEEV